MSDIVSVVLFGRTVARFDWFVHPTQDTSAASEHDLIKLLSVLQRMNPLDVNDPTAFFLAPPSGQESNKSYSFLKIYQALEIWQTQCEEVELHSWQTVSIED